MIGSGWYGKADLLRLIQVAPVEVVSLCDVDKKMLAEAAEIVSSRQKSKKTPRTFGDYRQMLAERDLDLVLIATPDHWHALPMIAAVEAGADVYVQKPISVDVLEGEKRWLEPFFGQTAVGRLRASRIVRVIVPPGETMWLRRSKMS